MFESWKKNSLLKIFLNVDLLKRFIGYDILVESSATVTSKCNMLLVACQAARLVLIMEETVRCQIEQAMTYVWSTPNAA